MNKKYVSYIIAVVLCLNLLPQINYAFKLDEAKTCIIYHNDEEKKEWETFYMPYAKHLRLVNKKTTMLELAKAIEKETPEENLIAEIMNRTIHERDKLLVKWERDNGYIVEEVEEARNITPTKRLKLLQEVREEERLAKEKEQTWWKRIKSDLKIVSFGIAFVGAMFVNKNVEEKTRLEIALKWAAGTMLTVLTTIEVVEAGEGWVWNKIKGRLRKGKEDEEIKIPPLQNMPVLPKNYERVDVYSYGL